MGWEKYSYVEALSILNVTITKDRGFKKTIKLKDLLGTIKPATMNKPRKRGLFIK